MDQVAPTFTLSEESLAGSLGLPRREIREKRTAAQRGEDWELINGKVLWTEDAAKKLLAQFEPKNGSHHELTHSDDAPVPSCNTAALSEAEIQELEVLQWMHKNTRVITCRPATGINGHDRVVVRVKDARLFRTGQKILARPNPTGSAWQFAGNPGNPTAGARYPRSPGRW